MRIEFPAELPISQRRGEIAEAIAAHQVVVVCGQTGSGKTTQIPKICLELGRGLRGERGDAAGAARGRGRTGRGEGRADRTGLIGCTQPRRIAARSVASRLAFELGEPLGEGGAVGFKVRFTDRTSPATRIKVMTDGILLAETQQDRLLRQYDTIIIDEAHERSVNIDFLLGYLKRLLPKRPDLKVIVTSATIDPETFSRHFNNAPVVEVSGRTYPVETRYRPIGGAEGEDDSGERITAAGADDRELYRAIVDGVEEVCRAGPGDVLVFLPGEREIREAHKALRAHHPPGTEILPLYARLSTAEQDRVFSPRPGGRRIVLATNVAETSLTVPGIRYVVDPGLARISRYSARAKVQRLPVEPISQASADQRKGRCGREAPGVCIRLYSQEDFESREAFTPPEIQRSNLAGVILQMKSLRLGEIHDFPFVEPPKGGMIRDGLTTLHELGALDEREELTEIGRRLSRLPVDPRIGRMILAAGDEGCLNDVLVIGAALSIQDPRLRPMERRDAADAAHEKWTDERSDFLSLINLWTWFHELSEKLGRGRLRKACEENFLSYPRMREWGEVYRQLKTLAKEAGVREGAARNDGRVGPEQQGGRRKHSREDEEIGPDERRYQAIHRALLTGLLANVATKRDAGRGGHEYEGTRNSRLHIHPGSGQFSKAPRWIMSAEVVETTRRFARIVARINPDWIEPLAGHLVKRTYAEPRWNEKRGRVEATERVTLLGLEIVSGRPADFGPIDPVASRDIFIREGLVADTVRTNGRFRQHNHDLMQQVEEMQARGRRRDLLADEERRYAFFDARLPQDVFDTHRFERWRKEAERQKPRLLFMGLGDVLAKEPEERSGLFPEEVRLNGETFKLTYRFEPGAPDDGVTITVPIDRLATVDEARLEWLVPGMLQDKVIGLIRSLPGRLRSSFAPAPDHARAVADHVQFAQGDLLAVTARLLARRTGVALSERDFDLTALPVHLRMNVRVVDKRGEAIAESRDLRDVRRLVRERIGGAALAAAADDDGFTQRGLRDWTFGDLPKTVSVTREGVTIEAYPAIVDEGGWGERGERADSVALTLIGTKRQAARATRLGLRRLFAIAAAGEIKFQIEHLPGIQQLRLAYATVGDAKALHRELEAMIVDAAFALEKDPRIPGSGIEIRSRAAYETRLNEGWGRIGQAALAAAREAGEILTAYQRVLLELERLRGPGRGGPSAAEDVRGQLERLIYPGFLAHTPARWRKHLPRYLTAAAERLARLAGGGAGGSGGGGGKAAGGAGQDEALAAQVAPFWKAAQLCLDAGDDLRADPDEVETFRWMVEELRVSLFAQKLGTSVPVSAERLRKQWEKVKNSGS